ncbi:hypothetical protein [Nocardia sp. NPDC051570]|uniref:hypothetical protein n=1 Tax=Nocardia sp. NPDC051570 TaxID=3364324 RepID=UPI0037A0D92B
MTVNAMPRPRSADMVSGKTNGRSGLVLAMVVTTVIDIAGQATIAGLGIAMALVAPIGLVR